MSDLRQSQQASTPSDFAQTTPSPDQLGNHRGQITFAIGQLDTHIQYLSRDIKNQSEKIDALASRSERELKERFQELSGSVREQTQKIDEQKAAIGAISDKLAEARGAFFSSKWFVAGILGAVVFIVDHIGFITAHLK